VDHLADNAPVILAMGGDGTVRSVAQVCYEKGLGMGIIPRGTFNYFARDLGIHLDPIKACEQFLNNIPKPVSIGVVNGTVFLNNASFGLYTELIKKRERDNKVYGRYRIIGFLSGLYSLFCYKRIFSVQIKDGGENLFFETPMIFVGNNTLQLENLKMKGADYTRKDVFALIILSASTWTQRLKLIFHGFLWKIWCAQTVKQRPTKNFTLLLNKKDIKLAIDGEIMPFTTPTYFQKDNENLRVIYPEKQDTP
jgi:diacylglycerol kinase family enzyme